MPSQRHCPKPPFKAKIKTFKEFSKNSDKIFKYFQEVAKTFTGLKEFLRG